MKKIFKIFTFSFLLIGIFLCSSCDLSNIEFPNFGDLGGETKPDEKQQLRDIYKLAVSQGYKGTYSEWLQDLKGDQIELRAANGYVQWRYTETTEWKNLISLNDLAGEAGKDGVDGLTPYVGANGNWWIGKTDTGVSSSGKSAYEVFIEKNPEYPGDENQWLDDLINGRLSDTNYKYYTVKFDDGSGETKEQKVLARYPIEKPVNPTKSGYIFTGWYVDGVKWNFEANVVLKDLTLKAGWVKSNVSPTIYFNNVYSDETNIYFDIYVDTICNIEAIALYKGGELVQTLEDLSIRQFSNLLSGVDYRIDVIYSYDLNDGMGKLQNTISYSIMTNSKNNPSVMPWITETTHNSITFMIDDYDEDNVSKYLYAEIYLNETLIKKIEADNFVFTDLLANTYYHIKIYIEYDYNNGLTPTVSTYDLYATTNPLFVPSIYLNTSSSTQNNITGEIGVVDTSDILVIKSIDLYNGDVLVSTGKDFKFDYKDLTSNTNYTVKVNYEYDINDGNGVVSKTESFDIATHPVYELLSTSVLNTSVILEGETIHLHAVVDNPSEATFTRAVVNGKSYYVNAASTSKNVYVNISTDEVGDVELKLDKLIATINGNEFDYYTEKNNSVTATIYQKLNIKSFEITNEDLEKINFIYGKDKVYGKVTLSNPVGYDLNSLTMNSNVYILNQNLFKKDNEIYYFEIPYLSNTYAGWHDNVITEYTYSNELISKTENINIRAEKIYSISSSDIVEIKTIDDLKNINTYEYKYYQLANDLDFTGIEWEPLQYIYGIFDGNGHSIKNMKIAKQYTDTNVHVGLFTYFEGVICNLTLSELTYMIDYIVTDQNYYSIYIGGFASYINNHVNFYNCHIDNNSSISFNYTSNSNNYNDSYYLGSFAGVGNCDIYNSSNSANISLNRHILYFGVFVGDNGNTYNSYNTGNITFENYSTNELRFIGGWNNNEIVNCYNTGAINKNYDLTFEKYYQKISNSLILGVSNPNKVLNWTNKTYSFETNGGKNIQDYIGIVVDKLPTPKKEGHKFVGWWDNEKFEGEAISTPYYSTADCKLYAKWLPIEEDISNLITNDPTYPFREKEGIIYSTIHEKNVSYSNSNYILTAKEKIRVYYETYSYGMSGGANVYYGNSYTENNLSMSGYVDLNPGEYLKFNVFVQYQSTDPYKLEIRELVVCKLD